MSKTNIIALSIIAIFILIGTFFDQQITSTLSGNLTIFARFFEIFGELPFTVSFSMTLLYFAVLNFKNDSIVFKGIGGLVYALGLLLSYMVFMGIARYLNPEDGNSHGTVTTTMQIVSVVLGLIYAVVITVLLSKKDRSELLEHKKIALFALTMLLIVIFGTQLIKIIWGRPRLWVIEDGLAEFRPWYLPKPFAESNGYMSFISGHTSNASLMILITVLPISFIQEHRKQFFIFGIAWGLLTGLSRLFAGQHFLTDVAFAVLFVGIVYNILSRKFDIEEI